MSFSNDDYKELEIVGFDGSMRGACGAFLPIVRDKRTDRFHRLSPRRERDSTSAAYSREITNLSEDNLITLLPTSKPAFPFAMILWVSQQAFEVANEDLPSECDWQKIGLTGWAGICVDEKSLELLHQLARTLMDKATDQLVDFFAQHREINCIRAKEIISMARAATAGMPKPPTPDWSLRAQIILRYALALKYSSTPERLDTVFELRIRREFPSWTWESFQTRVTRLSEMLHDQAFSRGIATRDSVGPRYMALAISKSITAVQSVDYSERILTCENLAEAFRASYEVPPEEVEIIAEDLLKSDGIRLTDAALRVLGGEPVFYYFCAERKVTLAPEEPRPFLSSLDFDESITAFRRHRGRVGQLVETLDLQAVTV